MRPSLRRSPRSESLPQAPGDLGVRSPTKAEQARERYGPRHLLPELPPGSRHRVGGWATLVRQESEAENPYLAFVVGLHWRPHVPREGWRAVLNSRSAQNNHLCALREPLVSQGKSLSTTDTEPRGGSVCVTYDDHLASQSEIGGVPPPREPLGSPVAVRRRSTGR
jgi:hypothetical protein